MLSKLLVYYKRYKMRNKLKLGYKLRSKCDIEVNLEWETADFKSLD